MVPRGVTVVSALHTVSAAALSDPSIEIDEDVLIAGDDRKTKDEVGGADPPDPRPAPGRLRRPRARADPRAAHAAADLDQQAPQDQALGHPDHGPRPARDRPAVRRHGRREAGARDARRARPRPARGGRQHRRRHRRLRAPRLPRPGPRHLLARRRDRRGARLRDRGRDVRAPSSSSSQLGGAGLVQARRPGPRDLPAAHRDAARGTAADGDRAVLGARASAWTADVLPMCDEPVQTYVRTEGEWRHFQEYLILQHSEPALEGVEFRGVEEARVTPEVLEAIAAGGGGRDRALEPDREHRPDPRGARDEGGPGRHRRAGRRGQPAGRRPLAEGADRSVPVLGRPRGRRRWHRGVLRRHRGRHGRRSRHADRPGRR